MDKFYAVLLFATLSCLALFNHDSYTMNCTVVKVKQQWEHGKQYEDLITVEDPRGHLWEFDCMKNMLSINDSVTVTFDDNGTSEVIEDDTIKNVKF